MLRQLELGHWTKNIVYFRAFLNGFFSRQISRQKGDIEMPRKGENIYLRKDGRWEGRYIKGRKPDGKPKFGSIYGKSYSDVKKRLVHIKSELYQDDASLIMYGNGTLHEWLGYWLEAIVRQNVKDSTYFGYRRILETHIYPYLGQINIQKLSCKDIQQAVDMLTKKMSAGTLNNVCRLLKSALSTAFERGVIKKNPYYAIKKPKLHRARPRVLSRNEQEILERMLRRENRFEYLLCLYTGLRVGELSALRWEDVDLENNILHVNRTAQRLASSQMQTRKTRLAVGTPKSASSARQIPLPAFIADILREQKANRGSGAGFLFPGRNGLCRDPRSFQQKLNTICKKAGLDDVHMHTLRHTFAARCLENGVRYDILSDLLGHSSIRITLDYYVHCSMQDKRESMEKFEVVS